MTIGPVQGEQPIDVRECAHVVGYSRKYTHVVYPMETIVGCEAILAHELTENIYQRHLAESIEEIDA